MVKCVGMLGNEVNGDADDGVTSLDVHVLGMGIASSGQALVSTPSFPCQNCCW